MARAFTRVTGQPAIHGPISAEEFAEFAVPVVGPAFKENAKEMLGWAAVTPAHKICYGAFDSDQSEAVEMLGVKATSFEDWLHPSNWKGPTGGTFIPLVLRLGIFEAKAKAKQQCIIVALHDNLLYETKTIFRITNTA